MGPRGSFREVFLLFARLGLTSFGGPIAHLGYMRSAIVARRKWIDEATFADLVALCQCLPGPASSQLGIAIGMTRAGFWGGVAAWLGFTLPSAALLVLFAFSARTLLSSAQHDWLHGLKVVAVAVVAQALWGMSRSLAPDLPRAVFAVVAAALSILWPTGATQVLTIALAGFFGWRLLPATAGSSPRAPIHCRWTRRTGVATLLLFAVLLVSLAAAGIWAGSHLLAMISAYYQAGSLVFGGGHVVLPLLEAHVVAPGWVTKAEFVAGYGAAQAVPGPLFSFAAYLGAVAHDPPNGIAGAAVALTTIYIPSFLLVTGVLPFWSRLREAQSWQSGLRGINAAVVGILAAALYRPVMTSSIFSVWDALLAAAGFSLLKFAKWPPLAVVLLSAAAGALIAIYG